MTTEAHPLLSIDSVPDYVLYGFRVHNKRQINALCGQIARMPAVPLVGPETADLTDARVIATGAAEAAGRDFEVQNALSGAYKACRELTDRLSRAVGTSQIRQATAQGRVPIKPVTPDTGPLSMAVRDYILALATDDLITRGQFEILTRRLKSLSPPAFAPGCGLAIAGVSLLAVLVAWIRSSQRFQRGSGR